MVADYLGRRAFSEANEASGANAGPQKEQVGCVAFGWPSWRYRS